MYIMCLFRYGDQPTFWSKHSPKGGFQVLRAFLSVVFFYQHLETEIVIFFEVSKCLLQNFGKYVSKCRPVAIYII